MLEKMARATYDKWIEDVRDLEPAWGDLPESHRARLIESTRAALMTVRDATNDQWVAGIDVLRDPLGCLFDAYAAMIDVILTDASPEQSANT